MARADALDHPVTGFCQRNEVVDVETDYVTRTIERHEDVNLDCAPRGSHREGLVVVIVNDLHVVALVGIGIRFVDVELVRHISCDTKISRKPALIKLTHSLDTKSAYVLHAANEHLVDLDTKPN